MAETETFNEDEIDLLEDGPVGPADLPELVLTAPGQTPPLNATANSAGNAYTGSGNTAGSAGSASGGSTGNMIADAIFAGVGLIQSQQAADAQADSLRRAARNLYTEAAQTMRQGEYVAMSRGLDLEQRLGSLKVAATASGVDTTSGSIRAATHMTETFGRLDVQMERLNAARRAKGLREQARAYEQQADFTEEQSLLGTTDLYGPFA